MQDLGIIGYVSKGDYDSNTTYEKLNVVFYNGASFSAKQTTTGNAPTTGRSDDLYWQIMASAPSSLDFVTKDAFDTAMNTKADNLIYDETESMLKLMRGSAAEGVVLAEVEITGGSPTKSTLTLWTSDSNMFGATGTVVIDGATYNFTLPSTGGSIKLTIRQTGTATITATNGGYSYSGTLSMTSFGTYSQEINSGDAYTINITTSETTLYGQTVTATYDTSSTKTATISSSGTASITLYNYTGSVELSATDGDETATATVTIVAGTSTYTADLSFVKIYGISWDGSSTSAWTRTGAAADFTDPVPAVSNGNGSSPFDDILPWSGMEIVDDATAGKLVKIPKYYYKWTKTGTAMTLQITNEPVDGFHVSPAHADRGDGSGERDYVYVGRYHCSTSNYKSTTGVAPKVSITRSTARTAIKNLGSGIYQYDFAMYWTIMMLYLVEYADWNSQAKIGYGCAPTGSTSAVRTQGYTDAMVYHTGTDQANRTTYGGTQYRYIEGLWDNCYDWCDGIYFSTADVYIINNPANFSDTTGGTKVGERATTANCIKSFFVPSASGLEWALYPDETISDSNYETYVCDQCNYKASGVVLCVGGYYSQSQNRGAFYLYGSSTATYSYANIGARLQKLPV